MIFFKIALALIIIGNVYVAYKSALHFQVPQALALTIGCAYGTGIMGAAWLRKKKPSKEDSIRIFDAYSAPAFAPQWEVVELPKIGVQPSPVQPPRVTKIPATGSYREQRYARMRANGGSHTAEEWEALCTRYGYRCLCCGRKRRLTKDHIVPVIYGGTNNIDNIQPLCGPCNSKKGTRTIDYRLRRKPKTA